ncbi:hypothetical protein AU193_06495 [Mycobacterium sp. GA-1285]|nr:hypothetical protein AU193_06495 [Mycobacterium sp. GA-1285]
MVLSGWFGGFLLYFYDYSYSCADRTPLFALHAEEEGPEMDGTHVSGAGQEVRVDGYGFTRARPESGA